MFKRGIIYNLKYFTWYYIFAGFIFTIPIWVAFYIRVITLEQMAVITALESIIIILMEVPTGALADLIGRRITIFIGMLIRSSWAFFMPFMPDFTGVLILSIIGSFGETLISGADSAILYDSLKEQGKDEDFGKIYVKLGFYYRIGLVLGSLAAGWLFSFWYGAPYIARGITYLLGALSILLMVEPKIDSEKFSWRKYLAQTKEGIKEITQSTFVKKLALYYVVVAGITWSCLIYFNQPYAYAFGWTASEMSYLTALAYLVSSVVLYFVTSSKNLLNRERVYLAFPLLMIIAFLPGSVVGKYLAIVLMTLSQIAGSGRFAILDKYINKEFSSKNRATSLSTMSMLVNLFVALLIFIGGYIIQLYSAKVAFTMLGITTLVLVLPLSLMLIQDHRQYKSKLMLENK